MNALIRTTGSNVKAAFQNVLIRVDLENHPIVFLPDTLEGERMVAFKEGKKIDASLALYRSTLPLSEADTRAIAQQYAAEQGVAEISIRERLPRRPRQLENKFAPSENKEQTQEPKQSPEPKPISPRAAAARRRMAEDKMRADLVSVVRQLPPKSAEQSPEERQKRIEALAKTLATVLADIV